MVSCGIENNNNSFKLLQVSGGDTFGKILESFVPDDWGDTSDIIVKASQSKSSSFDKFNLCNTVDLVMRILRTDVLWVKYEKMLPSLSKIPTKNAFDVLRTAQSQKKPS